MNPEEFQNATNEILTNLSDQAKVTETLSKLNEAYKTTHTTNSTLQEQQTKHEKEISALKETNMNLFLKINTPQESPKHVEGGSPEDKLTFEALTEQLGGTK